MRAFTLMGLLLLWVAAASAQAASAVDVATDRFRPALDPRGLVDVESADVGHHLDGSAALWLGWDHQAIDVVDHRLMARLAGSLSLFELVSLGAEVPAVLDRGALGDLRVLTKLQALRSASHAIDVAIAAAVTVPTAAANAFVGEHAFTFAPEVLVGRSFGVVQVNAQGGVVVRPVSSFGALRQGSEARLRAGVGYRVPGFPVDVEASANTALPMFTAQTTLANIPAEALIGTRVDLRFTGLPLHMLAYAGLGIGGALGTPTARAGLALLATVDGPAPAPSTPPAVATRAHDPFVEPDGADDSTDDGADDSTDDSGAESTDEVIDDATGEVVDESADSEGVEAPEMAFADDDLVDDEAFADDYQVVFAQELAFEAGSAELSASALAQLDEVAALWRALALTLTVAGHGGSGEELTERRADALRAALAERGVVLATLVPGPERPLTSSDVLLLVARAQD